MASRQMQFAIGSDAPFAVQLRLTPEILHALRAGIPSSAEHQIHLEPSAGKAVLTLESGEEFKFKTLSDKGCMVVRTQHNQETAAVEGLIAHKLQPVKSLNCISAAPNKHQAPAAVRLPQPPVPALKKSYTAKTPASSGERPASSGVSIDAANRALAAARQGSVRLTIIALLENRPRSLKTIRSSLEALEKAVSGFRKPSSEVDLQLAVKAVANFKAPGNYSLKPGLETEISHLPVSPALPDSGEKRRRADTDSLGGGREQLSPAARLRATPSLPSIGTEEGPGGGGASSLRQTTPHPLSSVTRCSAEGDETWVLRHAQRSADPTPIIASLETYKAVSEEYKRRHEVYFKLHQLLSGNRRDFEALQAALDSAGTAEERSAIEGEIANLWARRAERAELWQAAFRVLHKELENWHAALTAYKNTRMGHSNGIGGYHNHHPQLI